MKAVVFVKESKRLPGKHLLDICGEPMLSRICRVLRESRRFDEILVYSKYRDMKLEGLRIERDKTEGVLIDSITSAIESFGEFLAVGGDMPLIDGEVISKFLDFYDGVPVAAVDYKGIVEPLFAIYNKRIYKGILEFSKNNRKIFPFIERAFNLIWMSKEESAKLFNVNTEKDYEEAKKSIKC